MMSGGNLKNVIEPIDFSIREMAGNLFETPTGDEIIKEVLPNYPRSLLRYPGGKSRAARDIVSCIPKNVKRLCSPFLGGGSIELACTSLGIEVYGYDIFPPLIDFWHEILENPKELAERAEIYLPLTKEKFYCLQKSFMKLEDKEERAAVFYVLNRSSFSGTTLSGGMSPGHKRFNRAAIERVRNFEASNLHIEQKDFRDSLSIHKNDFLYLDPPYANGQAIYGNRGDTHKDFDHHALSEILNKRENWILSYNDCELVRELYKDFQFVTLKWNYGMNTSKKSNEVLIVSGDLVA